MTYTVAEASADYFSMIREFGESATLRRSGYGSPNIDVSVYVKSIRVPIRRSSDEIEGQSSTTARRYLILFADIGAWPVPIARGDQLILGDLTLAIHAVDEATRRLGGQQLAIEVEAYGA